MNGPLRLTDPDHYQSLLSKYTTFLFDCDGVIWTGAGGEELTPSIIETISLLRSLNKQICFCTNNATLSRHQYLAKFHRLGLSSVVLEEIFTCGSASATHLRDEIIPKRREKGLQHGIYVVGQESLEMELREVGLEWTGGSDPADDVLLPLQDFSSITPDKNIGIVLFSFQMRWNYKQLAKAFNYLASNPHCELILTNDDHTVLIPDGVCPGEGAMASVLYGARKDLVPTVVGKPNQPLLDAVHSALKFDPKKTIMIGDRLETDVLFGKRGGVSTMLVLTGSSKLHDLVGLSSEHEPDYISSCVGDLLKGATVPNGVAVSA